MRPLRCLLVATVLAASVSVGGTAVPAGSALPGAGEWLRAARTGAPLRIGHLRVVVERNGGLMAPGLEARDGRGRVTSLRDVVPLRGTVVGSRVGSVRVTVWDGKVAGYVWTPASGTITIGPRPDGMIGSAGRLAYPDLPIDQETGGTGLECFRFVPEAVADPVGLVGGWPERTFDVAFAADADFEAVYGADWAAVAIAMANGIDGVYAGEIQLRLRVADLHGHLPAVFPAPNTGGLLSNLRSHAQADHAGLARENMHLFTGKNLIASGIVGQASCIGGAGDPSIAYTVGMAANLDPINFQGLTFYGDGYVKIAGHEMLHILSAHHHYANCLEAAPSHDPGRPVDVCTIMANSLDFLSLEMSSLNRLVTRGWADDVGL